MQHYKWEYQDSGLPPLRFDKSGSLMKLPCRTAGFLCSPLQRSENESPGQIQLLLECHETTSSHISLSRAIPTSLIASENRGYKVMYDGGSLTDIKAGTAIHMSIEQDKVRFFGSERESDEARILSSFL